MRRALGALLLCLISTEAFMCKPSRLTIDTDPSRVEDEGHEDEEEREDDELDNKRSDGLTLCDIHVYGLEGCTDTPSSPPSNLGSCIKIEQDIQLYLCRGNEVLLSKCSDQTCTKCSEPIPNPYSYIPAECNQGTLMAMCTPSSTEHIEFLGSIVPR